MSGYGHDSYGHAAYGGEAEGGPTVDLQADLVADSACVPILPLDLQADLVADSTFIPRVVLDLSAGIVADSSVVSDLGSGDLFLNLTGRKLRVNFPQEVRFEGTTDAANFDFRPLGGAYPFSIERIQTDTTAKQSGSGVVVDSLTIDVGGALLPQIQIGDYLSILEGPNVGRYRITALVSPLVSLDSPLVTGDAEQFDFVITSAVQGLDITTSKATNGATYYGRVRAFSKSGDPVSFSGTWVAYAERPQLDATGQEAEGDLVLDFGEAMRFDAALTDPNEYTVTGPSTVEVVGVRPVSSSQVALKLSGLTAGSYLLTVNAAGTPKDVAGNPIDPLFNTSVFSSSIPLASRSIFTDKGPIARPPLNLREGINATILNTTDVQVPVGTMASDVVGRYLKLIGTGKNDGDYMVTQVLASNRVRVKASFSLPDTQATTWSIYDPRDGQIADDPAHVSVRINGTPVVPESVIGLLGQVVLPFVPAPSDDVKVDYSWVCNPTVDCARLNSKEFRFNNWNRDLGRPNDITSHKYRYNNVLLEPSSFTPSTTIQQGTGTTVVAPNQITLAGSNCLTDFVGLTLALSDGSVYRIDSVLSTTSVQVSPASLVGPYASWAILDQSSVVLATSEQPYNRELHYRAYERAYTPVLNDPNLLVFNTPIHKVAYPPLERRVSASFVTYDPTDLPENMTTDPWDRLGSGSASIFGNELYVDDTLSGPFPSGQPLFWRRDLDLTFPHVFALAWRMYVTAVPSYQGVFSGVAAGYSTDKRAVVVGFVEVGGVKKFGVLRQGYGDNPGDPAAWIGGIDGSNNATNAPVDLDWTVVHSYRLYRGKDGIVRIYLDGGVVETLRVYEEDLPFLEEVAAPFNEVQQAFWGSISRPATSTSVWGFVRYQVLPTNPLQTEPSIFVSYEANQKPEASPPPWTPIGYHGTETIQGSNYLLLESTSATDTATEAAVGLIGGDFRGFTRLEPLLAASSDVVLDVNLKGLTSTHGIAPNAIMAAIDDGDRLTQLSFLTSQAAPKLGYGGRSLPTSWSPTPWFSTGTATGSMLGRVLRIEDASNTNGLVYYVDDLAPQLNPARVIGSATDYMMEFRCQVRSYVTDPIGFAGVTADVFDGGRTLGVLLQEVAGVRKVALHSDGTVLAAFTFNWFDGQPHTYRIIKNTGADIVSLFVDSTFLGSLAYTSFTAPGGGPNGVLSFGSAHPLSSFAVSVVDWHYVNSWRVLPGQKYYVGLWRGADSNSLVGYHLPLKVRGSNATVVGNVLTDTLANFLASVVPGDVLVIDSGGNKGTYEVAAVPNPTTLVVNAATPFPLQPSEVDYRVPSETDWTTYHKYRLLRTPSGDVSVLLDSDPVPLIQVGYNNADLPPSGLGVPTVISGGLPSIVWGAFDPTNLSSSSWDYVRYGITRSPTELRIVPHHQVMNQRNVIASPEHLRTVLPHAHTDYWSSSTGIPPQTDPDFLANPALLAYTQLNDGTPLVPWTQTWAMYDQGYLPDVILARGSTGQANGSRTFQAVGVNFTAVPGLLVGASLVIRSGPLAGVYRIMQIAPSGNDTLYLDRFLYSTAAGLEFQIHPIRQGQIPTPVREFISSFNTPEDVFNSDGDFKFNDGATRWRLLVPDDVLYNSLQVIEQTTGTQDIIAPFDDECNPQSYAFTWQKEVCLSYDGSTLPENAPDQPTPWVLAADDLSHVTATSFAGSLTFGTDVVGTRAIYRNATPLTDSPSLSTQITFRMRVLSDGTFGLGDSQIRLGFSAIGMTLALAFVTYPSGDRYVVVLDLNSGLVLGGVPFDFLDGAFHTYRIERNPGQNQVSVSVVS